MVGERVNELNDAAVVELYGSPVSNCYNTVLASLHYKGIAHHEYHIGAAQDSEFLRRSPMGKIPYICHDGHFISETTAIVDYLDEVFTGPVLCPGTALQRARRRQLIKFIELYVELPARRLFPGTFWFQTNDPVHLAEVRPILERGLNAIEVLLKENAFLLMSPCAAAEFYSYFSLALVDNVCQRAYDWDLWRGRPLLKRFVDKPVALGFVAEICAQREGAMQAYLDKKAAEAIVL